MMEMSEKKKMEKMVEIAFKDFFFVTLISALINHRVKLKIKKSILF